MVRNEMVSFIVFITAANLIFLSYFLLTPMCSIYPSIDSRVFPVIFYGCRNIFFFHDEIFTSLARILEFMVLHGQNIDGTCLWSFPSVVYMHGIAYLSSPLKSIRITLLMFLQYVKIYSICLNVTLTYFISSLP